MQKNNESFCYICNRSRPVRKIFHKGQVTIVQCSQCKARFRPREEHLMDNPENNGPEYYKQTIRCNEGNRLFFSLVLKSLLEIFPQLRNDTLLDFGCGAGNCLVTASGLGFDAYGVDSSPWAIDYCRSKGLKVYESMDRLKAIKVKFGIIDLNHVLEHISDPVGFLSGLEYYLKDDGIIRIEVPNCSRMPLRFISPGLKVGYIVAKPSIDHLYYYDNIILRRILVQAGYDIVDIHTEGFGAFIRYMATTKNPDWRARLLSKILHYTQIEKLLGLENFLVALAKKKKIVSINGAAAYR